MLILASASPRRQELLRLITPDFKVIIADIDETLPEAVKTENSAEFLAVKKCLAVAKNNPDDITIGADTIVVKDNEILGKPADEADAKRMLMMLSGQTHTVYTWVCIADNSRTLSFTEETEVTFFPIPESAIDEYIKTGSPLDKAGAYGIQDDIIKLYTKKNNGNFESVMGLPVASLKSKLILAN
jgi:septum formation protein